MTVFDMVKEWLRYANNDLISARVLFDNTWPRQTENSAWHCQQCTEKALKAFLVANNIDPPKIHDLEKLNKQCKNIDSDFSEIEIDCKKIDPYGVASRYPDEIEVDETIVQSLLERAQRVYNFCIEKTNALFVE